MIRCRLGMPDGRRVLIACCVLCLCKASASTAGGCAAADARADPPGCGTPTTMRRRRVRRIMGTIYCPHVGVNESVLCYLFGVVTWFRRAFTVRSTLSRRTARREQCGRGRHLRHTAADGAHSTQTPP